MSDLKLVQADDGFLDLFFDEEAQDLVMTDDLENSVAISIGTIARALPGDDLPDFSGLRRGWWGDSYLKQPEDTTGSRLWILSRSKLVPAILPQIKQMFEQCLAWMVQDGVATTVRADAAIYSKEVVQVRLTIRKPEGTDRVFEYYYNWEAQRLAREFEEVS